MITSDFYATKWLFTFFAMDLPPEFVEAIISLFLLEGYPALIRTCLALLKSCEESLFKADSIEDIMAIL